MTVRSAADLKLQFGETDPNDHNIDLVDSLGTTVDATASQPGRVELATDAETITGTDDTRAVTPAGLAALTASATRDGLVELATDAEAITGADTARAVTPANLAAAVTTHVAAASSTVAGKIELATDAEAITGTAVDRAVTPANLAAAATTHVAAASASVAGKVELATDAEAKTGSDTARAVTPANVRAVLTGLKFISFDGRNNVGACTAVGAALGDKVLYVAGLTSGALGNASASFEATVTVADQVQQSAVGDLSLNDYLAVLLAVA